MSLDKGRKAIFSLGILCVVLCAVSAAQAQESPVILSGAELTRIVPPGFYFEGQSAPTQMRNSAAARLAPKRHVIAGMVDTTGYSSDVRAKYEGFFITDSAVQIGEGVLAAGAYGFGFTQDGQFNLFDVGGQAVMSVRTTPDPGLARPRPLMMSVDKDGLRLYSGRNYVRITARPKEIQL
ncbi:MAG TPA: hypothetical protein VGV59_20055 [Pyrinomonadaceae bacterium]|nr:hypothetical protein [Pyrinomonadaceae bacterium]